MANKMTVVRNKRARGYILKVLELTHPTPTGADTVALTLQADRVIDASDIAKHEDYLKDRGYIETVTIPSTIGDKRNHFLKLTSKGIDLLEETIQDPGVDL